MLATLTRSVKTSLAKRALRRGDIEQADRLDNEVAAHRYRQLLMRTFDRENIAAQVMADAYERTAKNALQHIHSGDADFIERCLAVPDSEGNLPISLHNSIVPAIYEAHSVIKEDRVVYSRYQFEKARRDQPLVIRAYFTRRGN